MRLILTFLTITLLSGCFGGDSSKKETVNKIVEKNPVDNIQVTYQRGDGLHGYLQAYSSNIPDDYLYGTSHYSPVWSLIEKPIDHFQIGLPGTWLSPNNDDNENTPLCPKGTYARDNWPERAPTYSDVFQTIEGSSGFWVLSRFKTTSPKYSLNSTPDCYNTEVASPGWPFFHSTRPLNDDNLGVAQLSNRMLMPPDGLPFNGDPKGELIGYGYFSLPLRDQPNDGQQTGNQHWTLFLNSSNFKGPLAFFVPEMWSDIAINYSFDRGRGLDSRKLQNNVAMAMEMNTVPQYQSTDSSGAKYTKIPQIKFPLDDEGKISLVKDLQFYSKQALFDLVMQWRNSDEAPSSQINTIYAYQPSLQVDLEHYESNSKQLRGFNKNFDLNIFSDGSFGIHFPKNVGESLGKFPRYFKEDNNSFLAISEDDVPQETKLIEQEFAAASKNNAPYSALPLSGAWQSPGPVGEEYIAKLGDCTTVTYFWYRFIDQPVFQQYNWANDERNALQALIEKMHTHWTIEKEYLSPVSSGTLASFDDGLIVTPPNGLEVGYVPIVVKQERNLDGACAL